MLFLLISSILFITLHNLVSGSPLRKILVNRLGQGPYMGLFSLASIATLAGMIFGYIQAPQVDSWGQVYTLRPLAATLLGLGFFFLVLGMLTPNSTGIGGENLLAGNKPPQGIMTISRHPFLVGMLLWSGTHLIYNGDYASLIFFGSFFWVALLGMFSIDRKLAKEPHWNNYREQTSRLPFLAIIQGRTKLDWRGLGLLRLIVCIILFMGMLHGHELLFGVAPLASKGI